MQNKINVIHPSIYQEIIFKVMHLPIRVITLSLNSICCLVEFHHSMREQMPHIYVSKVLFSKNGSLESQNFPTNRLIECKDSNGCTEHKNRIDNSLCNAKLCIENALEFENKSSTKADLDKDILNGENSSKLVCGSYIQEESCYGAGGVVGAKLCVCCSGTDGQTTQSSSKLYNQHNCLRTS